MASTYKFTPKRPGSQNKSRALKLSILISLVFLVGLLAGYWFSLMRHGLEYDTELERVSKLDDFLKLYKEKNSILMKIIELNGGLQKASNEASSQVHENLEELRSGLTSLKGEFDAVESKLSVLENRQQERIQHTLLLPERVLSDEGHTEPELSLIKGRVTDVSGLPRAGVEVKIENSFGGITNDDGVYVIKNVPRGDYLVQAISGSEPYSKKKVAIKRPIEALTDIITPEPVREVFFCRKIEKRIGNGGTTELIVSGADNAFEATVGQVFCYTQIIGAQRDTLIKHRWFWKDELESEVALMVRSIDWRTYSAKQIPPSKTGEWRVEVTRGDDGTILASKTFTVR